MAKIDLKVGPRSAQDGLKTIFKAHFSALEHRLDFVSFWGRFWLHFASPNASLLAPFWRSKSIKKSIRNRTALKVAPRSPQERPRPSQDAPRTPPESPRTPQEASWTPPGCPRRPPGPPRTTQNFFRIIWPYNLFRKNRKLRNRRNTVEKKVGNGHPRWSLTWVGHKNRKYFHNGRNPEGGGGGRAKRSYNPPPPAAGQQGVL